ncbi:tRNA dihydrouridine synthase DusB [Candidatus Thioglobus sp.]|uniref:tRNA dihydrouridine synthase DusB n=1 Tax=Candidatus Thioglobus sp. TaxID=2026721 RepID=UPI001D44CADF|nr:tRNA dihydrouridine synthase DusB [Candidatus Thioglobus sp.]MBT3277694.1 tRNA dihydrouridine synthase DusB [Candidatus Thioglobus sp.]MBT3447285.1 tRNA dihydrouridine synthase DusB [Candidatus Thioglobus sp.]MBT4182272.1 tRNA dihydrouridine synthase DusB [Candidatus Thioglobus sp.]MBT4422396.1 tRNA dihydrouridine synthase DusB [Candidatus Thioglobus sp.]MBT4747211.1 tRNA dihydrouridine synthase DusB [Candidatus Thioglobus sp.]
MQVGPYQLNSIALLAPMAGTSDKPFRMLCKSLGAGLTTSEMVVIQAHLLNTNKSKYRLDFKGETAPISIQIAGSEAQELAHSAQKAVEFGADIIDINMGCPAKKVCNKASGSALMQDEVLVKNILESVVSAVNIPVTLKMRTGWDADNKNAPTIAQIAEQAGIQMLSVHGRTKADKYNGMAEYDTIKSVVNQVNIPVIANGDIISAKKAQQVLDYTNASGVMIGRAAQGNPWIFSEINHYLNTKEISDLIPLEEKKTTILKHIQQIYDFYGDFLGLRLARKHILWYATHLDKNHMQQFWQTVNKITNREQQFTLFENYLNQL